MSGIVELPNGCTSVLTYHGAITSKSQDLLRNLLENQLDSLDISKTLRKRMIALSIECLHNLYHHHDDLSKSVDSGQMIFSTGKQDMGWYIVTGNYVSGLVASFLEARLAELKRMSEIELHEHYIETLSLAEMSSKGGAGLGFIDMMRKTNRQIDFSLSKHNDDLYYFYLRLNLHDERCK